MKKTILLAMSACLLITAANAQPFKPVGGEKNLQLLFTPWGNTPISLNNGIYFRKFNADATSAWRIGFSIGSSNNTTVITQADDTISFPKTEDLGNYTLNHGSNAQADQKDKTFSFSIRPGYEMHLPGTDRLSPYWGAELIFSKTSTKRESDEIHGGDYTAVYYDTTTVNPTVSAPYTNYTLNSKTGSTTFGLNLIAGFDYYIAKNLSLGGELNFGYSTTSNSDAEMEYIKNTFNSTTTDPDINFVTKTTVTNSNVVTSAPNQKQGSSNGFGPGVVAQIKLGWIF